jgi:hypothetical protein
MSLELTLDKSISPTKLGGDVDSIWLTSFMLNVVLLSLYLLTVKNSILIAKRFKKVKTDKPITSKKQKNGLIRIYIALIMSLICFRFFLKLISTSVKLT